MFYPVIFIIAVVLVILTTPIVVKLGIIDKPNSRKIHSAPIPKAGGIGIFTSIITIQMAGYFLYGTFTGLFAYNYLTVVMVTLVLMVTGILDDMFDLNPWIKLLVQTLLAMVTVYRGIQFSLVGVEMLNTLFTALWIIGLINGVNLIDGLDGLACGVTAISCTGFGIIGLLLGLEIPVFLCVVITGACLGFLKYNFYPARIFMGDSGSQPLGYNLAILGILYENSVGGSFSMIVPVIMLGIPIYDTLLSVLRRLANRKSVFQPDSSHFYNILMDVKGFGHKKTVLFCYFTNAILAAISVSLVFSGAIFRIGVICFLAAAGIIVTRLLGLTEKRSEKRNECDGKV